MARSIPFSALPRGSSLQAIPGDPGWPLVGHSLTLMRRPLQLARERYDQFGPVSWSRAFGLRLVTLLGPDANEFVLQNRGDLFSNHQGWDFFIGPFFRRGIMLLDFEEHRWHRRIMQQAFRNEALRGYLTRMGPAAARGCAHWPVRTTTRLYPRIKQLTLDLATDVFMGQALGPEADAVNRAFIDTVRAGTSLLRFPMPGGRWKRGLQGRAWLEAFFREQVRQKRDAPGADLFSMLCQAETEDGERFSDDDVINHMIFMMMAAHDTTTITLTNILYWTARHPDWQERLRKEARSLGPEPLDWDGVQAMHQAGLVMKEALRLCAPVPSIPRRTVKDVDCLGYHLPRGTMVVLSPYFTHFMEEYWPDPLHFDPLRFSEERREDRVHPYAWVPFGGGAHKCIGLHFAEVQVRTVLHQLLLRYRWSVAEDYVMPLDFTSLPVPADGLPMRLEPLLP